MMDVLLAALFQLMLLLMVSLVGLWWVTRD